MARQPLAKNHKIIIDLLARGVTLTEIAKKFDVTPSGVHRYRSRHKDEIKKRMSEYMHQAAGVAIYGLNTAMKILSKKLEEEELNIDSITKITKEFRAIAESVLKETNDINITKINSITIEQMAGQLANTKTEEQLEEMLQRATATRKAIPVDTSLDVQESSARDA